MSYGVIERIWLNRVIWLISQSFVNAICDFMKITSIIFFVYALDNLPDCSIENI